MKVSINNEYGTLKCALVASASTYFHHSPINNNQKVYANCCPQKTDLLNEQSKFFEVLRNLGVQLIFSQPQADCPDQHNARDASFVIGEHFFVSNMKEPLRKNEKRGLAPLLKEIESPITVVKDAALEGGDIAVCGNTVYVGISQRTDERGVQMLKDCLGDKYTIIPIKLKPGFLHLDTVFNPFSQSHALVCLEAIEKESYKLIENAFTLLNITLDEQLRLGTNVLAVSPQTVISQSQNARINECMRAAGFCVVEVDYSAISKLGGAFRCEVCPLIRR